MFFPRVEMLHTTCSLTQIFKRFRFPLENVYNEQFKNVVHLSILGRMGIPNINSAPPKPKRKQETKASTPSKTPNISHLSFKPTPLTIFFPVTIKKIPPNITTSLPSQDPIIASPHITKNTQSTEVTLMVEDTLITKDIHTTKDTLTIEDTSIALEDILVFDDIPSVRDEPYDIASPLIEYLIPIDDVHILQNPSSPEALGSLNHLLTLIISIVDA